MTRLTQPHRDRLSSSLAHLAALDLSSDDIVRPEFRNGAIPAGRASHFATSNKWTDSRRAAHSE